LVPQSKKNLEEKLTTFLEILNRCSLTRTQSSSILSAPRRRTGHHGKRSFQQIRKLLRKNSTRLSSLLLIHLEIDLSWGLFLRPTLKYWSLVTLVLVRLSLLMEFLWLLTHSSTHSQSHSQLVQHLRLPKKLLKETSKDVPRISTDPRMEKSSPSASLMILTCQRKTYLALTLHLSS